MLSFPKIFSVEDKKAHWSIKVLGIKINIRRKQMTNYDKYIKNTFLPNKVRLEACTICQLRCKCCYMRNDINTVGFGYLKYADFKKFVDNNSFVKDIELSNSGEIFLNKDLVKIIKYAYVKGVNLTAWNGVNFNDVTDELLEALVIYQFKSLTISLDGTCQETYTKYRVGGDFNKVIENIKRLNQYKEKHNSVYPVLSWQFIVFGHNEKEIPIARKMAKKYKFNEIYFKLNWDENFSPIQDDEFVKKETGLRYVSRSEYLCEEQKSYTRNMCMELWKNPVINWDGKLLGCCNMYKNDFGINVFKVGLGKALSSKKYKEAQKMLANYGPETDNPCLYCERYQVLKETRSYLTLGEIDEYKI